MTHALKASALLAAGVLALTACGGGDEPAAAPVVSPAPVAAASPAATGDAAKITELARAVVRAQTVGDICREKFSAKFVTTVFGSVATCEAAWSPDDPADRTQDATVSDIRVDGLAATATVTEVGGEWDGAGGTWAFIRAGDTWRIAAWGVDYLRAAFRAYFGPDHLSTDPGNLLSDPAVSACVSDKVQRPKDKAFTRFTYRLFRGDARAAAALNEYLLSCAVVPASDGITPLRRTFEVGVKRGAERGGRPELAGCVARRLRTAISDQELIEATTGFLATGKYPKPLQRRVDHVSLDCALKDV